MNQSISEIVQDIEFIKDALTSIRDNYPVRVTEPFVKKRGIILDIYIGCVPKEQSNKPNRFDFPSEIKGLLGRQTIDYVDKVAQFHEDNRNLYLMISEFANRISDSFEIFDFYESLHGYITFKVLKI